MPGWIPMPRDLGFRFIKHSPPRAHSPGAKEPRMEIMSVSSVSSVPPPVPVKAPEASEPKPEVKVDSDADDSASAPPAAAPLPPGQGTRINTLV
jgi:hypothetical protein